MSYEEPVPIPSSLRWKPLPAPLETAINSSLETKTYDVNVEGQFPCRRCLQNGKPGDQMLLLSYDPFLGDSPYRHPGPIWLHLSPACHLAEFPQEGGGMVPLQQKMRVLSLRAYDSNHCMQKADIAKEGGHELNRIALEMFEDPNVEYLNVHNAKHGCWAVRIERADNDA